jgi:hypothetical protein
MGGGGHNYPSTLIRLASKPSWPSEWGPAVLISGLFLFVILGPLSSLRKEGPDPATGVAKFRGLGNVVLLSPLKFHSG